MPPCWDVLDAPNLKIRKELKQLKLDNMDSAEVNHPLKRPIHLA